MRTILIVLLILLLSMQRTVSQRMDSYCADNAIYVFLQAFAKGHFGKVVFESTFKRHPIYRKFVFEENVLDFDNRGNLTSMKHVERGRKSILDSNHLVYEYDETGCWKNYYYFVDGIKKKGESYLFRCSPFTDSIFSKYSSFVNVLERDSLFRIISVSNYSILPSKQLNLNNQVRFEWDENNRLVKSYNTNGCSEFVFEYSEKKVMIHSKLDCYIYREIEISINEMELPETIRELELRGNKRKELFHGTIRFEDRFD